MFELPYDTRIGRDNKTDKLILQLTKARTDYAVADQSLLENTTGVSLPDTPDVYLVTEKWRDVDYFTQVIRVPHEWKSDEFVYFMDVRQQTSFGKDDVLRWKSSSDRMFTLCRLLLTIDWSKGNTMNFFTAIEGAGLVYTTWLTRAIGRVFPINVGGPAIQMRVSALAGIFFWSQFFSNDSLPLTDPSMTRSKSVTAAQISKAARVPSVLVEELIDLVGGKITSVEEFVKALTEHSESLALENINVAKLFNALSMTWFGANATEHAAYAVEYPPTFYAMILTAMKDNSFRKTVIGEIVKDNVRNHGLQTMASTFKKITTI